MDTEARDGRAGSCKTLDESDTGLALGLREHSPAALAEVYRRFGPSVVEQARRLGRPDAAEDVAQQVFLALWRDPARFEPSRGSLRTYLLTLVRYRSIDNHRSEQSRRRREETSYLTPSTRTTAASSLDDTVVAADQAARVRASLDDLPRDERLAIDLAYFGHHTYREVAQLLGQPEGTVKSRIRRGLQTLRSATRLVDALS